ncbi:MAG: cell division protein ZapE [Pseudomonadales bacterium]|jgi:cell division protein ZapE|nr:cell division protein ZapE [Pseudomonadales bacterium]
MTPAQRYALDLSKGSILEDPAQAAVVPLLDDLAVRLAAPRPGRSWLDRVTGRTPRQQPPRGLYLWGGVGRGKTYLMDLFYECLPFEDRLRVHFYRFMRRVQDELRGLGPGADPLHAVAERLAAETRVVCFDEFFVSDIADAMILGGLFDALFARGVALVATSNVPPRDLYRDGLQRRNFLPAIALLETHTQVVHLDGALDYRLRALEQAELYHAPLDEAAERSLARSFAALTGDAAPRSGALEVEGRQLETRALHEDVVWFDFAVLCEGPRSQNDYISLAREFHSVIVSGVPRFGAGRDDAARRFISLVDEFYDRGVKLILSAEAPIEALYEGGRLGFEFERTRSRLLEMQSRQYLARDHVA